MDEELDKKKIESELKKKQPVFMNIFSNIQAEYSKALQVIDTLDINHREKVLASSIVNCTIGADLMAQAFLGEKLSTGHTSACQCSLEESLEKALEGLKETSEISDVISKMFEQEK